MHLVVEPFDLNLGKAFLARRPVESRPDIGIDCDLFIHLTALNFGDVLYSTLEGRNDATNMAPALCRPGPFALLAANALCGTRSVVLGRIRRQ